MPRSIRECAAAYDPRDWRWIPRGWSSDLMPPYHWSMQSTGAPYPFEFLRGWGWMPTLVVDTIDYAQYLVGDPFLPLPWIELTVTCHGTVIFDPIEGPFTVSWTVRMGDGFVGTYGGRLLLLYPNQYSDREVTIVRLTGSGGIFPDTLKLVPEPYWVPDGAIA